MLRFRIAGFCCSYPVVEIIVLLTMLLLVNCGRDFGFDPLGLGEVPENLEGYKESELIHSRWAMLAVVSVH
jgi:hypothetical protein